MRKFAACLLTFCLAGQQLISSISVYAQPSQKQSVQTTTTKGSKGEKSVRTVKASQDSEIEVVFREELKTESIPEIKILDSNNQTVNAETVTEKTASGLRKEIVTARGLKAGEPYTVRAGENSYETYTQKITTKTGVHHRIQLNNNSQSIFDGFGRVLTGDVTGDGVINETDKTNLIHQIKSGNYKESFDLNGDQKIDLIDLQYLGYSYDEKKITGEIEELSVLTDNVKVKENDETKVVSGKLEDVLKEEGGELQLKPAVGNEISEEHPVTFAIQTGTEDDGNVTKTAGLVIKAPSGSGNTIQEMKAEVEYLDENGALQTMSLATAKQKRSSGGIKVNQDGSVVIDLGKQIAVKKVTIKITGTSSNKLAEIAKVEFLNDMESRIPEPEMNIPKDLKVSEGNKQFTVSWGAETNVTEYEVSISQNGKSEIKFVSDHKITVTSFGGKELKNKEIYQVKVRSVNGDWKSEYSESVDAIPQSVSIPPAPENITVTEKYKKLDISWKKMDDTDFYTLYYKEDGASEYTKVEKEIKGTSHSLSGLKDKTKYLIYLVGNNEHGVSPKSAVYSGTTQAVDPPITPDYKLINTSNGKGELTAHIKRITDKSGKIDWSVAADDDYATEWISNGYNSGGWAGEYKGPVVEFDDFYEMNQLVFVTGPSQDGGIFYCKVVYWDEKGTQKVLPGNQYFSKKTDKNGKAYFEVNLPEKIKTNKIQVNLANYAGLGSNNTISELKFYYYDSLEDDINALYADDLHVTLKKEVTQETIDTLRERLNTKDEVSKEFHPKKSVLETELETAEMILNQQALKEAVSIDTTVTKAKDSHITFKGGLNAYQPLGVTARAGDQVIIFVGSEGKKTGDSTNLNLVATQYHGDSNAWQKSVGKLKVGRNVIDIPSINSKEEVERGGQLYIEYTGNNANEVYGVRVSGGDSIPVLDLTKAKTEDEKKELIQSYVKEIEALDVKESHDKLHSDGDVAYSEKDCILGATDIVLSNMMYSVSSRQIVAALKGSSEEKTEQLYKSLTAMEKMVNLFYQHKGLSNDSNAGAKNKLPSSRLNIRYQRMFAGAFMYAAQSGGHIGIEWGSVPGLASAKPVVSDENGKYQSGNYFGWGIAHEIGHIINEKTYEVQEVTNNYFAILAQAKDTNDSVRFNYDEVYKKVTSGVKGASSNGATQLGMYWQLHLAYDKAGYNFKTYEKYEDQFNNLIFARIDSYARDTSKAPAPKDVKLTLNGDTDNNLMRLACAGAKKNILEFFERWGMTPDETTKKYAAQFEKETKPIYFISDEARDYELSKKESVADKIKISASLEKKENSNKVTISLDNNADAAQKEGLIGYEIFRNGTSVGFAAADKTEYVDTIATVNNRVFTYEVVAYDKLLNATNKVTLDPVKVSHDGSLNKAAWSVTTNMSSDEDEKAGETDPCEPVLSSIKKVINNDTSDIYTGKSTDKDPEIILRLNETNQITGLKYQVSDQENAMKNYKISVSKNGTDWTEVKSGTFQLEEGKETIYFNKENDPRLQIYDAAYVKLTAAGQKSKNISVSELDLLAPTGDNVELESDGIGILSEDYAYDNEGGVIPKGSLIFTGSYKGNPAYNVVMLYNEKEEIIEGSQIIFAEVPEHGELGNISKGTWVYYIEPEEDGTIAKDKIPASVKAQLYRVDDAGTLEGQRLVSDALPVKLPEELKDITIKGSKKTAKTVKVRSHKK